MTPITPQNLEQYGFRLIEWNRGVILEYWKSFRDDNQDFRIGVRFGEFKDVPYIVWLVFPDSMYALKHFNSIEQVEQLLDLLSG